MGNGFPEQYLRSCTFQYLLIFRDCFCRTPSMKLDNQPRFAYVGKIHSLKKMRATPALLWWFMENEARPEFTISSLCQTYTTFKIIHGAFENPSHLVVEFQTIFLKWIKFIPLISNIFLERNRRHFSQVIKTNDAI